MRQLLLSLMILLSGCHAINQKLSLNDENLGEEILEGVIEHEIGLSSGSIDLTPESPE